MIVVYVHGNGNKVREELLKRQWDQALFGRDVGSGSRMAYWAPLLHPQPLPDTGVRRGRAVRAGRAGGVRGDPRGRRSGRAGGGRARGVRARRWPTPPRRSSTASSSRRPAPALEALPLPRAARIRIFEQLVKVTFRDVHAYFFRDYAERMRAVVRAAIAGIDEPFVLVSHSLGTIIAYDVLREEASRSLAIPLFVTVGSPLGVQEIQDLVARPLEVPAAVGAWLNASDFRDVVALDHTLKPEYAPPDRCTDLIVENSSANHHGIREYLAAAAVRDPILAALSAGRPSPRSPRRCRPTSSSRAITVIC